MSKNNFGNDSCKLIVDNICPYCHKHLKMNKRSFANHIRWCTQNPRYEEIRYSTYCKQKLYHLLNPIVTEHTCKCIICQTSYIVNVSDKHFKMGKYKKTCSDKCAKILTAQNTNKYEKNKKLRHPPLEKICKFCGKLYLTKKKNQKFCSNHCAKQNNYQIQSEKKLYKSFCKFKFALNQFPEEFDFNLINVYGWYKAKNNGDNPNGVSRDHCYSIQKGFENLIDPYIISHPANCALIQQIKNEKKSTKCTIQIDELINKIHLWNKKYGIYKNNINYELLKNAGINLKIKYQEDF